MCYNRGPVGGDIVGYRGLNGCIVRYNQRTHELVKAYIRGVASYMIPDLKDRYYEIWLEKDGGVTENTEDCEYYINTIDVALRKFILEYDLIVAYKGSSYKYFDNIDIGDIFTIPSYFSTSLKEEIALKFCSTVEVLGHSAVIIYIRVPKGTSCIYIGDNTTNYPSEYELLLARDLNYKVINKTKNEMILEVIP